MKKTTLFLLSAISSVGLFAQENVEFKGMKQLKYEPAYETPSMNNQQVETRSTTIERWVSFVDAYEAFMGSSHSIFRITNGAFTNDTNVFKN